MFRDVGGLSGVWVWQLRHSGVQPWNVFPVYAETVGLPSNGSAYGGGVGETRTTFSRIRGQKESTHCFSESLSQRGQ